MKKNLLFLFVALFLTAVSAGAYNVRWMVDTPGNIKVTTNAGYGTVLDIASGQTNVDDSDNPLLIEGVGGAVITSLSLNMEPVSPSGDGAYRIGITGNSMIQVTTEGGSAVQTVTPYFFIMADDYNNSSAIITYGDGLQVGNGQQASVDKDTEFTISPAPAYEITKVECSGGSARDNGDGTYTYIASAEFDYVYIYTQGNGVKVTLNVDFADNVSVFTGISSTEAETPYTVYSGKNTLNIPADRDYIQFYPADGASLVSVTRNGDPVSSAGYRPWRAMIEEGDVFDVITRGKPVTAKFISAEGQAPLETYTFTAAGETLALSGTEASADLHLGDVVTVAPKGAAKFRYVFGSGIQSVDTYSFRITSEEAEIYVYGEKATGININVTDAAQIVVKQSNGYGDLVDLQTGLNTFAFDALGGPLRISAAEGCEILGVTLDGEALSAQNSGAYLADLSDGCYIDIRSREIPADVPVTFSCLTPGFHEGVELTVNGEVKTLDSDVATITIPFEAVVTVKARFGYNLTGVTSESGFTVTSDDEGLYSFVADRAGSVTLFGSKIEAGEGQALLTLVSDSPSVRFYEYNGDEFVQTLTTDNVNVVTIGNTLSIRLFMSNYRIGKVTVDGNALDIANDTKSVECPITSDAVVSVETYAKVDVATYDVTDPVNYSTIGKLYIKVGDELLKNYSAAVGETITFVSENAAGYQLDYVRRVYPESDLEIHDTYTITQEDFEAEYIMFQGVYSASTETPSYVVRCNQTWIDNELVGYVLIDNDGVEVKEFRFLEGDQVRFNAYARDDYDTVRFMLWRDNDVTITSPYTVNGDDADTEGVIDIAAEFRKKGSGVDHVTAAAGITYDSELQQLSAQGAIRVYNALGAVVLASEDGTLDVSSLRSGIYVAVAEGGVLKFAK